MIKVLKVSLFLTILFYNYQRLQIVCQSSK